MNKTKIPWADYTINPVKGLCPMACPYCYARKMHKRFKWNPEIRYDDWVWQKGGHISRGSKVFVGSTMELFGDWVKPEWLRLIFEYCEACTAHTFIFLTKQPQNLIKWSPFPDNCWVGVSAIDNEMSFNASCNLILVEAKVKFISFEPLLGRIGPAVFSLLLEKINWVIIGSQTQPTRHPPREWVDEIITAADKAKIPVFVKEPMASHYGIFRQEFPYLGEKV